MNPMFKKTQQRGFTLVELLIAMTIFIMFVGILLSSYTYIVRSQREANDYRELYAQSRQIFDKLVEEMRAGMIYYPSDAEINSDYQSGNSELTLVKLNEDDGSFVSAQFLLQEDRVKFIEANGAGAPTVYFLNSGLESGGVGVSELVFYVSPAGNPYSSGNTFYDSLQFQPKITVFATFEKKRTVGEESFVINLQTTISSRFYAPLEYNSENLILPNDVEI